MLRGVELPVVLFAAVVSTLVLAGVAGGLAFHQHARASLERAWAAWARRHGLVYVAPTGEWPNRAPPRITGRVGGCPLHVELVGARNADGTRYHTRVRARAIDPLPVALSASRHGRIAPPAALGDGMPSRTGDPYFDQEFVLRAIDGERVGALLDANARRDLLRFASSASAASVALEYLDGEVRLVWDGEEQAAWVLDEARALVSRLSGAAPAGGPYR